MTFLFTDVEGSTRLLHQLGPEEYARALDEHRRVMNDRTLERIHAGLEAAEFTAAWEQGAALTVEEVVDLALTASVRPCTSSPFC